jgi:hypothetical protein
VRVSKLAAALHNHFCHGKHGMDENTTCAWEAQGAQVRKRYTRQARKLGQRFGSQAVALAAFRAALVRVEDFRPDPDRF